MAQLVLILVTILFMAPSFASQQVLTCGHILDLTAEEGLQTCDEKNECGHEVAPGKYLSPWMELWITGEKYPSLHFLKGMASFLKFSTDDVSFQSFFLEDGYLGFEFQTVAGELRDLVQVKLSAQLVPSVVKNGVLFEGQMTFDVNSKEGQENGPFNMFFGCMYQ